MATYIIKHPQLGQIKGRDGGDVLQFIGIKYGSLRARFAASQVADGDINATIDATTQGLTVVSPSNGLEMEGFLMQQSLPLSTAAPEASDFEGLTLNITTPKTVTSAEKSSLPVLVFFHGGGFAIGGAWYPQYDQAEFVRLSVRSGNPVLAVAVNYRIGAPGFLTSGDLRRDGYPANNGILDQKIALRWVRKYIAGFGGNPQAVSAIGQSAGAASIMFHLQGDEELFQQAILMGGTSIMLRPVSLEAADKNAAKTLEVLLADTLEAERDVPAIEALNVGELQAKSSPALGLSPVVDGGAIPEVTTYAGVAQDSDRLLSGKKWCQRIFTIDSEMDASIVAILALSPSLAGLRQRFQTTIRARHDKGDLLLDHYGITNGMADMEALGPILRFYNDIDFYAPSLAVANAWPRAHVGHFNEGNPWEGPFQAKASHLLDVAYLWQNFHHKLSPGQRRVAEALARDVIGFAAGTDSLPVWNKSAPDAVGYGPSAAHVTRIVRPAGHADLRRDAGFVKLAEQLGGLDKVFESAAAFLAS